GPAAGGRGRVRRSPSARCARRRAARGRLPPAARRRAAAGRPFPVTIYTRGYRRYEGALDAKGPRWAPIFVDGYQDAVRGPGFRVMFWFIIAVTVVLGFLVYFELPFLTDAFLEPGERHMDASS